MADRYYPKYYQKKKQRDQIFLNIWRVVLIVVLGIAVGTVAFSIFPMSRNPNGVADLAEQKEELEVERDIDQANQVQAKAVESLDLSPASTSASLDEIRYVASQPSVHVEIQGVTPEESADPHTIDDNPADPPPSEETPPSETASATSNTDSSTRDSDRLARGTPGSGNASGEQTETGSQGESISGVPGRAIETTATSSDPQEKPKPAEKPKDDTPEVAKPKGGTVYLVFAGYYDTKDEAVSRKKDLSTLGFSGTVQEGAGTYSIYVSKFDDSDKARALEGKLEQNGFPDAFVVRSTS